MNVVINSQVLAAELRLLNKVVPSKPAIAILSHALLKADGDVSFYATDLEVGVSLSCEGHVNVPGQAAVPVTKLLQMVEQFLDGDVSLALDRSHLVVKCGAFTSRLQVLPVTEFPAPPEAEGMASTIDAAALRQLIARTRYAVSATATKFVLKGALLTLANGVAAMAATDSKRLALATASRTGPPVRTIVPVKALDVLAGSSDEGEVELTVGDRHLFFAIAGRMLTSRKIEGEFPKYERVIPRDNDKVVTADRLALTAALKRVALVSEENCAIYFNVEPGTLELTSASSGIGSANEAVRVAYEGPPLKVCANGGYVLDFLNAASEPTITMALKDARTAMLLSDGTDHVAVVMLMKA